MLSIRITDASHWMSRTAKAQIAKPQAAFTGQLQNARSDERARGGAPLVIKQLNAIAGADQAHFTLKDLEELVFLARGFIKKEKENSFWKSKFTQMQRARECEFTIVSEEFFKKNPQLLTSGLVNVGEIILNNSEYISINLINFSVSSSKYPFIEGDFWTYELLIIAYREMPGITGAHGDDLDLEMKAIESRHGFQRLAEWFAARSSAGTSAHDLGMETLALGAANSKLEPPHLDEAELADFQRHAAEHPWLGDRKLSPSAFIEQTYAKWLGRGLARSHIIAVEPRLASAYAAEVSREPSKRLSQLITRPSRLPAGAPRSPSKRGVAELSDQEIAEQREKQRLYRARVRLKRSPACS